MLNKILIVAILAFAPVTFWGQCIVEKEHAPGVSWTIVDDGYSIDYECEVYIDFYWDSIWEDWFEEEIVDCYPVLDYWEVVEFEICETNSNCDYYIYAELTDGYGEWLELIRVVQGNGGCVRFSLYYEGDDGYVVDVIAVSRCDVEIVSFAPQNGCTWFKQGSSLSKSDFDIVTNPEGEEDAACIVLQTSTVNSVNISGPSAFDPGGTGTFAVSMTDGTNTVSNTYYVVDESQKITITPINLDSNKLIALWNEAKIVADQVGLTVPAPSISGSLSVELSKRLCGCSAVMHYQNLTGTVTGTLPLLTITSPEFPVYGVAKARIQFAANGTVSLSGSGGQSDCVNQKLCGSLGGNLNFTATGAICAINCNLISVSVGGTTTIGISGTACTDGSKNVTPTVGGLVVTGTITTATIDVAQYSYTVF